MVGSSQLADGSIHAFLWTRETGMQDLGTLPDDFLSVAPCCRTVNERRQVVGFSIGPAGPRAFLWQDGMMRDLNDLVPGSPLYLLFAQAINSRGEIAGIGVTSSGELHAFMASPTDGTPGGTGLSGPNRAMGQVYHPDNVRRLLEQRLRRLGGSPVDR